MNKRAKVLAEIERKTNQPIECPVDDATRLPSANDTSESNDPAIKVTPPKKQRD